MVEYARGSRHSLSYGEESVKGQTPTTFTELRYVGTSLGVARDSFESKEIRSDRQTSDFRMGPLSVTGGVDIEFSYEAFDSLLEGALWGDWSTLTSVSGSFGALGPNMITSAGGALTPFDVGDIVGVTGFTAHAVNNQVALVMSASAKTLILDSTTITDEMASETIKIKKYPMVENGTTEHSYSIQRAFEGLSSSLYIVYTGCLVNGFSLTLRPAGVVSGSFDFIGMDSYSALTAVAIPAHAATNSPFDSFRGFIKIGSNEVAVVTGLDIRVENGVAAQFAIGNDEAIGTAEGRCRVTGTVTMYFQDLTLYNSFINEEESEIYVMLEDIETGTTRGNRYYIRMPRVKFGTPSLPVNDEGPIILSVPFTALRDEVEEKTIKIAKVAKD
jgi:hypothetical protein